MSSSVVLRFADLDRWDPQAPSTRTSFAHPVATLAEIASVRLGVQVPRRGSMPVGVTRPYLRAVNVRRGRVDTSDVREMTLPAAQAAQVQLQPGDLLFVEGSGSVSEVGRAAIWDGSVAGCVHQNSVIRARLHREGLDSQYLVTWFNSRAGNAYIRGAATTTSGLFHIGSAKLSGAPVPVPDISVQRALVRAVAAEHDDAVNAAAESVRLRETAWATFVDATAHPGTAVAAENRAIRRFSELDRWDTTSPLETLTSPYPLVTLGEIGEVRLGVQVPAKGSTSPGAITPYLRAANVQRGYLLLDDVKTMAATDQTVERLRLSAGDVLVVEGNSFEEVGRAAVWPSLDAGEDTIIQNSIIRVRLSTPDLLPEFVAAWLNCDAGRAYARRSATSTSGSLWHIGAGKLASAPIPVPPLLIQKALVDALSDGLAAAAVASAQVIAHRERAEQLVEDALVGAQAP